MRPSKYDLRIYTNPNALDWAMFFVEQHPEANVDVETMFRWFANAMGAMHDYLLDCAKQGAENHDQHDNDNK